LYISIVDGILLLGTNHIHIGFWNQVYLAGAKSENHYIQTSSTKALVSDCLIISTILCVSHDFTLSWCGDRPRERRQ